MTGKQNPAPLAAHPDDETLRSVLLMTEADETSAQVGQHVEECQHCQQRIDRLAREDSDAISICEALRAESRATRSVASGKFETAKQSLADFAVSFLQPSDHPGAIGRLEQFDVLSVIGAGGMGIVLKGFQAELNRSVAVKVMAPHLAMVGVARQRFLREARAAAAIVHPNVMPVLSVGEAQSTPFLVMPYLACHSLQQRIDTSGMLPLLDLLRISVQVARGLAAAHEQGLIHRDIKPANILLERGVDRALLTDFGLARAVDDVQVTRSGVIAGTPQYMSPQQARGERLDARDDLFSLGGTITAMATGCPAFDGPTTYAVMHSIASDEAPSLRGLNPEIPEWLDRYVATLLAKDPEGRPSSATEVADTLQAALAHVQQPTVCDLPDAMKSPQTASRWRVVSFVVAVLMLVVLAWWRFGLPQLVRQSQPIVVNVRDDIDQRFEDLEAELETLANEVGFP